MIEDMHAGMDDETGSSLPDLQRVACTASNFVAPSVAVAWVVVKWVDSGPDFVAVA